MKKTVSVLLAAILLVCSATAFANWSDYKTADRTNAKLDVFTRYFDQLTTGMDLPFTWGSKPRKAYGDEKVYSVWNTNPYDDMAIGMEVYVLDDYVDYIIIDGSVYMMSESYGTTELLSHILTTYMSCIASLYRAEYSQDSYTGEELVNAAQEGWKKLLQDVNPEVFVPEGYATYSSETTVLNTPVGLRMFPDGSTFVVYMYILNPGSTFVPYTE